MITGNVTAISCRAAKSLKLVNVGLIMKSMGGGGHPGAGSAMIKSVNPEVIEEWIMELITGNQRSSVAVSDLMSFPVISVKPDEKMRDVAVLLREGGCRFYCCR